MSLLKMHFSNKIYTMILLPIVLIVYLLIIWPALSGPFVFDDFPNLQNLNELKNGLTWSHLGQYLASFIGSPGRPISALSFLINDYGWPSDPFSFKYTNVMIHLLNGVMLFGFLRSLAIASPVLPQSVYWPILAMAIWLFHPLQLSAQMLVVQRMTLLSASFCIAGLWAYVVLLQKSKTFWTAFIATSSLGIATILAFLCKENGALLPVMAFALNATLLNHEIDKKPKSSQLLITSSCVIPSIALIVGIVLMSISPNAFSSREFTMIERLMSQTHVLTDYMKQILIPQLSGSGIYFDDYQITRSLFHPLSTVFYAIGIICSIVFSIIFRKKFAFISFAILWFFSGHLMESTSLSLELYFEHRNYLPLIGPILIISAIPFIVANKKKTAFGLLIIWLTLLGFITALQAQVWGNQALMVTVWATEKPLSLRANQDLAKYYYDSGRPQEAFDALMKTYNSGVNYADLPMSALIVKCWRPQVQSASDIYLVTAKALAKSPYSNSAVSNIQLLRSSALSNECTDSITPEQWLTLTDIMLINPKYRMNAEGFIRVERANYFIHQRNLERTMQELEKAYAVVPTIELTQKIAEVLLSAGLYDEAEVWLYKGLEVKKPWFDEKLSSSKEKSILLISLIEKLKVQ